MANKNDKEVRFKLRDNDYKEFGRYRILFTAGGKKIVNRQRLTYIISAVMLVILFTVFKVDPNFRRLAYVIAAIIGVGGTVFASRIILKQQERAIEADANNPDRIHPVENVVIFEEDLVKTKTEDEEQTFSYSDIRQVDMTESAIYIWLDENMIMPLPLHAFKSKQAMEDLYSWIHEKIEAASQESKTSGKKETAQEEVSEKENTDSEE